MSSPAFVFVALVQDGQAVGDPLLQDLRLRLYLIAPFYAEMGGQVGGHWQTDSSWSLRSRH